jgi:hypothetical protein
MGLYEYTQLYSRTDTENERETKKARISNALQDASFYL